MSSRLPKIFPLRFRAVQFILLPLLVKTGENFVPIKFYFYFFIWILENAVIAGKQPPRGHASTHVWLVEYKENVLGVLSDKLSSGARVAIRPRVLGCLRARGRTAKPVELRDEMAACGSSVKMQRKQQPVTGLQEAEQEGGATAKRLKL